MSYAYKDEIWVQIICDSFHPKPNFCQPCVLYCVRITVWCHHRHSGDVICIQGRDLSTIIICDSVYPKPYYSPPRMSRCVIITVWCQHRQWRCHLHTRTRSEYKSFVDSVYIQNPITVRPVCQNVSWLLFDAITDSGDVICIQGRDLSTNHLFILFISKTQFLSALLPKCVMITVWCQHRQWRCHMHTRTRSEYKSFVILFIQNPISVSAIAKMCHYYCLMPSLT